MKSQARSSKVYIYDNSVRAPVKMIYLQPEYKSVDTLSTFKISLFQVTKAEYYRDTGSGGLHVFEA